MAFLKPDVNIPWGYEAGDGILEPLPAKVALGWIAEIPDYEYENWIQNRQDLFNAHVNERGIPEWDSVTNYSANKSYVQSSAGLVYRALTDNSNKNPTTNPSDWVLAFDAATTSYTKGEADGLFLKKTGNLSELTNKATSRTNLNVYSKVESDAKYQESSELSSMIVAFPVESAPSGWLACNGVAHARSSYPTLFARIGTSFGAGDGSTTFNVPNLENEFIRGASAGRAVGSIEQDALKSHNHTGTTASDGSHAHSGTANAAGNHTHTVEGRYDGGGGSNYIGGTKIYGGQFFTTTSTAGNHTHSLAINAAGSHTHTFTTANTGDTETRPRNIAMLYCIKT